MDYLYNITVGADSAPVSAKIAKNDQLKCGFMLIVEHNLVGIHLLFQISSI